MAHTNTLVHGKRSTYVNHKCRCDLCKEANAEYKRNKVHNNIRLRASQLSLVEDDNAEAVADITHGLSSSYEWHGCRCTKCTAAIRKEWRENKSWDRVRKRIGLG